MFVRKKEAYAKVKHICNKLQINNSFEIIVYKICICVAEPTISDF